LLRATDYVSPRKKADLGKALGTRQASVLEYLWAHGPQSVADLHRGLSEREDLAYTTVFTELSRMLKKGLVAKGNEGGSHLDMRYRAAITREGVVATIVAQTLGGLISAHGPAAVHGFVDAVANDPGALDELRRLLDNHSRKKR
jgi:predicted transcriptional regulator